MPSIANIVVVVPGILGTVLTKGGKKLWDLNAFTVANAAFAGGGDQALALMRQGSQDPDLGDGVVASALLENIEAVPGLWRLGGYSRLMASLDQVPGLKRDENLFAFPYDWRRDNRVAARRLAQQSKQWLRDWRLKSRNPDAKLIIIAHSMGGLVASYFADCLEGWREIHTLINIGVPFRGSANALNFLTNGFGSFPLSGTLAGRGAFASMDSVYQLLPTYAFVADGQKTVRVHEASVPGVDPARAKSAWDFHEELTRARSRNRGLDGYERVIVRCVTGIRQPTGQSAVLDAARLTIVNAERDGEDRSGDGTVPRISTTAVGENDNASTFVANTHAALAGDDGVIAHLKAIIEGSTIDLSQYRLPGPTGALSLLFPTVAVDAERVTISASTSTYHQHLASTIVDAGGIGVRQLTMYPRDGLYAAETKLDPGLYWVTVLGERARSASDVLVVAPSLPND